MALHDMLVVLIFSNEIKLNSKQRDFIIMGRIICQKMIN